jgi:L-cysteine/cystine lyase
VDRPGVRRAGAGRLPRLRRLRGSGARPRLALKPEAARYDTPSLPREAVALSLAALELLEATGWEAIHARAAGQAAELAAALAERGHEVAPRGPTTLVSWTDPAAEATRDRLLADGIVIRNLPGRDLVRASVGAWNDAGDLERLLAALA